MNRAIHAPQAPLRREPSHDTELYTEALRGRLIDLEEDGGEGLEAAYKLRSDGSFNAGSRHLHPLGEPGLRKRIVSARCARSHFPAHRFG